MGNQLVYCKLSGFTSSYKIPSIIDGVQLALSVPGYSSILGMLSYASGKVITPGDTKIGFKYEYENVGFDLEKFHRFKRNDKGKYNYGPTNIRQREFHHKVSLELVLDNLDLFEVMDSPMRQLTFGRSQDLAIIEDVRIVSADTVDTGTLWGTLIPIKIGRDLPGDGLFYNLPEYFSYKKGKVRKPKNFRSFLALNQYEQEIQMDNLYRIDIDGVTSDFYLHQWL